MEERDFTREEIEAINNQMIAEFGKPTWQLDGIIWSEAEKDYEIWIDTESAEASIRACDDALLGQMASRLIILIGEHMEATKRRNTWDSSVG